VMILNLGIIEKRCWIVKSIDTGCSMN